MTKELLQQGQDILSKIQQTEGVLNQFNVLLAVDKEDKVKTRIRGIDVDLPKAVFRGEALKQKKQLEAQLGTLQAEFDAL